MKKIKIDNFELSNGSVYIIAELSGNHSNDLNIALESLLAAKNAGANAMKIQTFTADSMTLDINEEQFMCNPNGLWKGKKLYDVYKEAALPFEWYEKLFNYAKKIGITLFSTPFDTQTVDFLEKFDVSAYKIASFEITDYELIRYVASKKKPIIISTGIATIDEIQDVVRICRDEGNENIILLKCTSSYPSPIEDANLLTIKNIEETFGVLSGFSDHTLGITAPIVAVCLGAKVIEKHFILDKKIKGIDSEFSLDKNEFKQMVEAIRDAEKLIGKVDYSLDEKRKNNRRACRSLYIVEDMKKGDFFSSKNVRSIRPGFGLHPKYLNKILGKRINTHVSRGTALDFKYLD